MKEEIHYIRPEFTLIDDREAQHSSEDPQPKEEKIEGVIRPSAGRLLCLLGFIFCAIFGVGMLLVSTFMTFVAALNFFQRKQINFELKNLWLITLQTFIAGFGCTIGLINPSLGIGLLLLYFSGKRANSHVFTKIFKNSFN